MTSRKSSYMSLFFRVVFALLWGISAVHCFTLDTDTRRLVGALQNHLPVYEHEHALRLAALPQVVRPSRWLSQTRKLKQAEKENVCTWHEDDEQCTIYGGTLLDRLDDADNVVAKYVQRTLECRTATVESVCDSLKCQWNGDFCSTTHEEFREFHDADCMEDVQHIVELGAGNLECAGKQSAIACGASERCTWSDDKCSFDKWYYYYGLRTIDAFPETFSEVFAELGQHVAGQIKEAVENGEIVTWGDLLDWDVPDFECPVLYKQAVCDFAEGLLPSVVANVYCRLEYDSEFDLPDCDSDPVCTADPTNADRLCISSVDVGRKALVGALYIFAEGIEDPEARAYEKKKLECAAISDEDECDAKDDCTWYNQNDACSVSTKWAEEEIQRLIGKSDDPVCQYFTLDVHTGCLDRENKTECSEDDKCLYSDSNEVCFAGPLAFLELALDVGGLLDDFLNAQETCREQETSKDCLAVTPPENSAPAPAPASMEEIEIEDIESEVDDDEDESGAAPNSSRKSSKESSAGSDIADSTSDDRTRAEEFTIPGLFGFGR